MAVKDKVVIVTGASSGIGEATAKGAKLVLAARREEILKKDTKKINNLIRLMLHSYSEVPPINDSQ